MIINVSEFALMEWLLLIVGMKLKEEFRIMSRILPGDATSSYIY